MVKYQKMNKSKRKYKMRKVLLVLVVLTVVLVGITTVKNDNSIIIYSSMEQFRNDELQKQLNERFPELDVYVMYVSTAKAAAKISIEGKETDADIVVGLEQAYMTKIEEHMTNAREYSHLEYDEDMMVGNGKYVVWERQAGSIIVNRTIVDRENLPMPEKYEDLLNPIYKNYIAMPDPKTSGTGYFFLKNLINVMGEEKAFNYMDKLAGNVKQFTESGSGPVKLLKQGEIAIGLGLTFQAVDEFNNGNDFMIIEPEYGSPYSLTCTSMLEGREKDSDIVRVFEFIVNDYMVYDKMHGSPEKVLQEQKNAIENYPTNINYADMTGIEDIGEKERLLAKWKY